MNSGTFDLATASLEPGTVLLEASAGTGKTYTLVGLLLRAIVEGRIDTLDQALVVTFTVAATEELKIRLREALHAALHPDDGDRDAFLTALVRRPGARERLRRALDDFDGTAVATMHGFCKRVLEEAAFESQAPFELEFLADPLPALYRAAADSLRSLYEPGITARTALLHEVGLVPATLVEHYRLWQRHPDVRLEPDAADPDHHVGTLRAAIAAAAAAWDDDAAQRLLRLGWGKRKQPFVGDVATACKLLAQRLRTEPGLALGLLCALAPANAAPKLLKDQARHLAHPFFLACDTVARACEQAHAHLRVALLAAMHARLRAHKRADHVLTFDDLMVRMHEALHDPVRRQLLLPALRARYRLALIDEFQDTDALQYDVFATCLAERPLFLIGDPKQSIYGFRGADLRSYLRASRDAVRGGTLATNWRSNEGLVAAVAALFGG
ncbi:MAG: UvrD-helicase domain-containing protein, partial [Planctomycetota bacterium]